MKIRTTFGIAIVLIISFTTTMAVPLSHAKIKQLIKKAIESGGGESALVAGMDRKARCKEVKINRVNIIKMHKTNSVDYHYIGEGKVYRNKHFQVDYTVTGSCKLGRPAIVGSFEHIDGETYQKILTGSVPLRNVPLWSSISNDAGQGWTSGSSNIKKRMNESEQDKDSCRKKEIAYRKQLYNAIGNGALCHMNNRGDCKGVSKQKLILNNPGTRANTYKLNNDDKELIAEVNLFFSRKPKVRKIFNIQTKAKQWELVIRIAAVKGIKRRYKVFLQIAKELEGKNTRQTTTGSGSIKHSHGGATITINYQGKVLHIDIEMGRLVNNYKNRRI